jgi:serine/threonine protein kinase
VIGLRVNNYELVSVIGKGGMGAVYLARHLTLPRTVAVKVMHRELAAHPDQVARFVNEARAANSVGHPGIVDVIDVGLLPGRDVPYLMMEHLEGEDLETRLERVGRLPLGEALAITRQVASALGSAHAAGLVHRDLKPDNLFLVEGEEGTRVKVLDFGIAKLRPDLSPDLPHTETGIVLGTPLYMSPEQCRGRPELIDRRTDIYALGLILFRMLCGRPAFSGEASMDLLVAHVSQPPPSPRALDPTIPPAVERVILRALAKHPQDRFGSMAELAEALADDQPPVAEAPRPSRRRAGLIVLAAAATGTAGIALVRRFQSVRSIPVSAPPPAPPPAASRAVVAPAPAPAEAPPAPPAPITPGPVRPPPQRGRRHAHVSPSLRSVAIPEPRTEPTPAPPLPRRAPKW